MNPIYKHKKGEHWLSFFFTACLMVINHLRTYSLHRERSQKFVGS